MVSDYKRAVCLSLLVLSACAGDVGEEAALRYPRPSSMASIPSPAPEPSTPSQVQTAIYNWFLRAGYPPHQAAALVDHARLESGLNPCIGGRGGVRYTYQWNGTRLQRLYEFAGTRTCPPLDKQLAFADNELRSNPNFSCFLSTSTREAGVAALRRGFGRGRC
ncbi:MAG: phage tail tip lysozyme [Alphaproteobacteria bacterium]